MPREVEKWRLIGGAVNESIPKEATTSLGLAVHPRTKDYYVVVDDGPQPSHLYIARLGKGREITYRSNKEKQMAQ